jgi:hypothetical protein
MDTNTKYMKKYARRKRNRLYVYNFLKLNPCSHVDHLGKRCTQTSPIVLQFHHRDRTQKRADISRLVHDDYSLKTIKTEIDKCDVLCANHHQMVTAEETHWDILSY